MTAIGLALYPLSERRGWSTGGLAVRTGISGSAYIFVRWSRVIRRQLDNERLRGGVTFSNGVLQSLDALP